MGDITELLDRVRRGEADARGELFTRVYAELAVIARARLADSSSLTQLDPQALVHEAYLRLGERADLPGDNRRAFYAYASGVMRSIVVDYVRERRAQKRGGGDVRVTLSTVDAETPQDAAPDVEALDAALRELAKIDARSHQVVELRYFGGLSIDEVSDVLELSPATVKRDWLKARAFLVATMRG
jgi:RNA polymerase sigma factor (TIGR02999 family)